MTPGEVSRKQIMKKIRLTIITLTLLMIAGLYSCDSDGGKEKEQEQEYSVVNTTWVYSSDSGGKNTFTFTDESEATFKQDWIDSGEEKSETKDATYEYEHPEIAITVGSKIYSGTIEEDVMTIGGAYEYKKQ